MTSPMPSVGHGSAHARLFEWSGSVILRDLRAEKAKRDKEEGDAAALACIGDW